MHASRVSSTFVPKSLTVKVVFRVFKTMEAEGSFFSRFSSRSSIDIDKFKIQSQLLYAEGLNLKLLTSKL